MFGRVHAVPILPSCALDWVLLWRTDTRYLKCCRAQCPAKADGTVDKAWQIGAPQQRRIAGVRPWQRYPAPRRLAWLRSPTARLACSRCWACMLCPALLYHWEVHHSGRRAPGTGALRLACHGWKPELGSWPWAQPCTAGLLTALAPPVACRCQKPNWEMRTQGGRQAQRHSWFCCRSLTTKAALGKGGATRAGGRHIERDGGTPVVAKQFLLISGAAWERATQSVALVVAPVPVNSCCVRLPAEPPSLGIQAFQTIDLQLLAACGLSRCAGEPSPRNSVLRVRSKRSASTISLIPVVLDPGHQLPVSEPPTRAADWWHPAAATVGPALLAPAWAMH
jgi:hypothetical protein